MDQFLKFLNYTQPNIIEFKDNNLEVKKVNDSRLTLYVDQQQWMTYNIKTHLEAYEFFSHYYLAEGHCICTGLGFGVRENWLLSKNNVSKITVLEKNKEVIEYHQHIKSSFLNDIELIHCDASTYTGKCDTLLLDHFEQTPHNEIFNDVSRIQKNIEHKTVWFWPLETIIKNIKLITKNKNQLSNETEKKYYDIYLDLKSNYFKSLPPISDEVLLLFIFIYHLKADKHIEKLLNI